MCAVGGARVRFGASRGVLPRRRCARPGASSDAPVDLRGATHARSPRRTRMRVSIERHRVLRAPRAVPCRVLCLVRGFASDCDFASDSAISSCPSVSACDRRPRTSHHRTRAWRLRPSRPCGRRPSRFRPRPSPRSRATDGTNAGRDEWRQRDAAVRLRAKDTRRPERLLRILFTERACSSLRRSIPQRSIQWGKSERSLKV